MELHGKKVILIAKEAGAGSLLAALANDWQLNKNSICIVSKIAYKYFIGLGLDILTAGDGETLPNSLNITELLHNVDAVVTGASAGLSIEKEMVKLAFLADVPSFTYVDHYWNLWQRFADGITAERWTCIPNKIFVPDERLIDKIIKQGAPQDIVNSFIHPLLNSKENISRIDKLVSKKRLNIPIEGIVILFVSEYGFPISNKWNWEQPPESDIKGLLDTILNVSRKINNDTDYSLNIVVKLHPADEHDWLEICDNFNDVKLNIIVDCEKSVLFSATDIAFGLNSMLLLEAAQFGIPSYSFHHSNQSQENWLSSYRDEIFELTSERQCMDKINKVAETHQRYRGDYVQL